MFFNVRIKGTPGPQRRCHRTSQLICELRPSLDIRGLRSEPWARRLPDGTLVQITSTPCRFGGRRWWLICPKCHRRCTVLYGPSCRLCCGAVHETTILSPEDRLREKALKIRRRLGQREGGLLAPFPPRPKHMQWATYMRLRLECRQVEQAVIRAMADAIGLVLPSEEPEEPFYPMEASHKEP